MSINYLELCVLREKIQITPRKIDVKLEKKLTAIRWKDKTPRQNSVFRGKGSLASKTINALSLNPQKDFGK